MSERGASSKYLLSVHALTFIVSICLTIVLPKVLKANDYVEVMKLIAVVNFIIPICSFGLPTYLMRNYRCNKKKLFFNFASLSLIGICMAIIVLFVMNFITSIDTDIAIIVLFLAFISSLFSVLSSLGRITKDLGLYFSSTFISKFFLLIVLLYIIYLVGEKITYAYYFELWLTVSLITLLIVSVKVHWKIKSNELFSNKDVDNNEYLTFKNSLLFCLPLIFSNLIVMLLPLVERYLLQELIPPEQMVMYLFNVDFFSKISSVFLLTLKVVVFPKIILLPKNTQIFAYRKYFKKLMLFVSAIFMLSPLLAYTFNFIILIPLGNGDLFDIKIATLLILYTMFVSVNYMVLIALIIVNKNKYVILTTTLNIILHVAGIYFLSPIYGALGASVSLLMSSVVSVLVLYFISALEVRKFEKDYCKIY